MAEESPNFENEWYAQTFNVSEEEAIKRKVIVTEAGEIANIFALEDSFAGMYITHKSKFRVVYTYKHKNRKGKDNLNKRLRKMLHKVSWKKYAKVKVVKYSALELKEKLDFATELANEYAEDGFSSAIDIKANKISLGVFDKYAFLDALQHNGVSIPKGIYLREITELAGPTINGGELTTEGVGGRDLCTVGFTVRNSANTLGVSSAHHCGGVQAWNGTALGMFRSIESRDTAWLELPANLTNLAQNRIRTSPTTFTEITGTQTVNTGGTICMYGATSGRERCGIVVYPTINTTYTTGQQVANLIYATTNGVHGGGGFMEGGDSGGPSYTRVVVGSTVIGTNAVGTNAATTNNESYIAPIANTTAMGVSVLTQ